LTATIPAAPTLCPDCGSEIAPGLRECPGCHRLVYANDLRALAAEAEAARAAGDLQAESAAWRRALLLLPPDSRQHAAITEKVVALSRVVDAQGAGAPPAGSRWARWLAPLGAFGLFVWKIKFVVALVLTKGKLLLLGLLKAPTLFSALASFGVYWTVWGWPFALGVVVLGGARAVVLAVPVRRSPEIGLRGDRKRGSDTVVCAGWAGQHVGSRPRPRAAGWVVRNDHALTR